MFDSRETIHLLQGQILMVSVKNPIYWLAFVGTTQPAPGHTHIKNLGVVIVESITVKGAIQKANEMGLNPGGEILATQIPFEKLHLFPKTCMNQLLTREGLEKHNLIWMTKKV
jgi:hypothetical protein